MYYVSLMGGVIVIKVQHSKCCKKGTIGQNDLKFDVNISEEEGRVWVRK